MNSEKIEKNAYILGAGPIGLITANELLNNGYNVTIFEKNSIVGGLCRTWKWEDFLVDTGPHIFHTPDSNLSKYWEKEFGDLFVKGNFWCQNVKGDKFDEYWDYPLSWESISKYPSDLKKKIIKELDSLDLNLRAKSKNYSEYIESFVGPTLKEMFFENYPKKIWGIPTDEMTPEWAPKRIEFRRGNAGGGNQLRQPYLRNYIRGINLKNFKEVDHVHFFGYYIGNYPSLSSAKIIKICRILNSIDFTN